MGMRVSIDKNDPGFTRYAELVSDGYGLLVLLDGVEIPGVVTADEERGEIIAQRYTAEGNVVAVGDSVVYDRHVGNVKIKIFKPNDDRVLH